MGYYSEVQLVIREQDYDQFIKVYEDMCREIGQVPYPFFGGGRDAASRPDISFRENGCEVIGWSSIKWYEEFPEVRAFLMTLNFIGDLDIPYEFARTGEEWTDAEHLSVQSEKLRVHIAPETSIGMWLD